jgi:Bacterial alpha-L-rhamnosidase 6 hairpin glycosidase domain
VWTRDISYSILLAFAYHEPEIAKISLLKKVKRERIIQDTGSGGAWPVSSDRTTWALAAWEIYKVTGDTEWLKKAYNIIKNTLDDDAKSLVSESGLYKGESSFLDWREQTYPKWMSNMDIYVSQNLGTNVVHYQAHKILTSMAAVLGESAIEYEQKAALIKNAINTQLWMPEKGYYAQFLYGRKDMVRSERFEALGEALAVLFDVADSTQSKSIFEKSPVTDFGATCIYPQIPGIPPYHNNAVWPFVQSYWNLAAAKAGNEKALTHGLSAIYRAGGLFLTNYENFVAQSGDFNGTEINSDRMLWSMAGNLAMVHRIFIGMNFGLNGIRFCPVIPQSFGGTKMFNGFKYRNAILNVKISGYGKNIKSFKINGKKMKNAFIETTATGIQNIEIEMDNLSFDDQDFAVVENHFTLPDPATKLENNTIIWNNVDGVMTYRVYKNGIKINEVKNNFIKFNQDETAEYSVSSIDSAGYESFVSEPILVTKPTNVSIWPAEKVASKSDLPYTNYTGEGFVEISVDQNNMIIFNCEMEQGGIYLVDFRYSNGSGPWNTDNKCAIRSLYCNDMYTETMVFPQRGNGEWSDWGMSNATKVKLTAGINQLKLVYEPWNINMNVDINTAMLDHLRLIRIGD